MRFNENPAFISRERAFDRLIKYKLLVKLMSNMNKISFFFISKISFYESKYLQKLISF